MILYTLKNQWTILCSSRSFILCLHVVPPPLPPKNCFKKPPQNIKILHFEFISTFVKTENWHILMFSVIKFSCIVTFFESILSIFSVLSDSSICKICLYLLYNSLFNVWRKRSLIYINPSEIIITVGARFPRGIG